MDRKKKYLIGAGMVVLAGLAGTGIFFSRKNSGEESEQVAYVSSVSAMNPASGVQRMAGVVESQETLDIQKNAEREVKEILVEAGDEVDVGTALFCYDTESLEAELQQAQLDLERADNDMENLRVQISQLEKEKKEAEEDEKFSYTTQIQTAQMDLKKSEYDRKAKEVEISQIQDKILNSTVTSEMKGVIKSINTTDEIDPYTGSSQAFMTILATGDYRVKGKVNEQNMWEIQEGAQAIVRSRVDESKTWSGTFTSVDTEKPEGNTNNMYYGGSSDGGETMSSSYPFYVMLDNSEDLLLGQHVYIEKASEGKEKDGIWLDAGYIENAEEDPVVWAEKDGEVLEKRSVKLGAFDEEMFQYQILEGLENSDYIAFPQEFLKEGMKTTHDESMGVSEEESVDGEISQEDMENFEEGIEENAVDAGEEMTEQEAE